MNIEKFTQKSLEALKNAQEIAIEEQNAQVEQEHLLFALLEDENGLIKELLNKMKTNVGLKNEIKSIIDNKPKIINKTNQSEKIYI